MNALAFYQRPNVAGLRELRNVEPGAPSAPVSLKPAGEFKAYLYAGVSPYANLDHRLVAYVDPPRVHIRRDGYGSRLPTAYAVHVGGRWRRLWAVCWSNAASYYVDLTRGERAQWPDHKRVRVLLPSL